jgi:nitrogen fixation NifU-like protein
MALDGLYLDTILNHYRDPHNHGSLDPCDGKARGYNPNCGDDVMIYVRLDGDAVDDIRFEGKGCAISRASASMMTDVVKGESLDRVGEIVAAFHELMDQGDSVGTGSEAGYAALADLIALEGVKQYPARIQCATLAWKALEEALRDATD